MSNSEVEDLDVVARSGFLVQDEDIVRLEIAMDDAGRMRGRDHTPGSSRLRYAFGP